MKKSYALICSAAAVFIAFAIGVSAQQTDPVKAMFNLSKSAKPNFFEIQRANTEFINSIPETGKKPQKQYKRWETFWRQRVDKNGEFPNPLYLIQEIENEQKRAALPNPSAEYQWTSVGPKVSATPIDPTHAQGLGRANVVRLDPTNNDIIWVGFASGGVAKSTNGGKTWKHFEFTSSLSLGVADIAISPSDPNVVYVATGDTEESSNKYFYSVGVIKTTNGGEDWAFTNLAFYLNNWVNVSRLLVQPDNSDIVIAATNTGILKTTNGGVNWVTKKAEDYIKDMEYKPGSNGQTVYASTMIWGDNKIFRSTDFGDSWEEVHTISSANRVNIEVTAANPGYIYAIASSTYSYLRGVYCSTDSGDTWELSSSTPNILGRDDGTGNDASYGQGRYDLALAVHPKDPSVVWAGGINVWKSSSNANNWTKMTHWYRNGQMPTIHADQHDMVFDKTGNKLYVANDGGLFMTSDNGATWSFLTNGMAYTQFYRFSVYDKSMEEKYLGGSQDNGTYMYNGQEWYFVMGGDGMQCIIDPNNPNTMYAEIYNGDIDKSVNGGVNFSNMITYSKANCSGGDWVTPYVLSPKNSRTIYVGYNYIVKSTDAGSSWTRLDKSKVSYGYYTSIAVSEKDTNYVYANAYNNLKRTTDGGSTWSEVKLPTLESGNKISWIQVDPNNEKRFWVSLINYDKGQKVLEYNNGVWTNISGNLPNVPVNCVAYQANSPERLFAGTDIGLFYCEHSNGVWYRYGTGLPNTVVMDIKFGYDKNNIYVATFGRAIWKAPLPPCNNAMLPLTIAGDTITCEGYPLSLEAPDGYTSYLWSSGETTRSISPAKSGVYGVSVFDANGCLVASRPVKITVNPSTEIKIGVLNGKRAICNDADSVVLYLNQSGIVKYEWSNGESTYKTVVYKEGVYSVKATNSLGCFSVDEVNIFRSEPIKPSITSENNVITSSLAKNYQWYFNGTKIDSAISKSYQATQDGLYYVEVTDTNGCYARSDDYSFAVSAEDGGFDIVKSAHVVPNPNSGEFDIVFENISYPANIQINNILGQGIFSGIIRAQDASPYHLNLSDLPHGVYFVYIKSAGKTFIEKFIKE